MTLWYNLTRGESPPLVEDLHLLSLRFVLDFQPIFRLILRNSLKIDL